MIWPSRSTMTAPKAPPVRSSTPALREFAIALRMNSSCLAAGKRLRISSGATQLLSDTARLAGDGDGPGFRLETGRSPGPNPAEGPNQREDR